jgi:hypothetical protein
MLWFRLQLPSDTSRVAEPEFSYSEQLEQTLPSVPLDGTPSLRSE